MDEQRPDLAPADPSHAVPSFDIVWRGFNREQVQGHLKLLGSGRPISKLGSIARCETSMRSSRPRLISS
jgi:hypothetical protein